MTLNDICLTTNSDKSSNFHDYCRTYDELFAPLRDRPICLLEMGILGGDSLLMWSRYFSNPQSSIIGIDIETHRCQPIPDERVKVIQASQTDFAFWSQCADGQFDCILDDGGHFFTQQIAAFAMGWSKIKPGGYWIIEDCHTYASPQHSDGSENLMHWLCRIATEMQGKGADASGRVEPTDQWHEVDTITFRKGLCIIRKAR